MRYDSKSVAVLVTGKGGGRILVGSISKVVHCEVKIERVINWT